MNSWGNVSRRLSSARRGSTWARTDFTSSNVTSRDFCLSALPSADFQLTSACCSAVNGGAQRLRRGPCA
jgi:hypothetical protein